MRHGEANPTQTQKLLSYETPTSRFLIEQSLSSMKWSSSDLIEATFFLSSCKSFAALPSVAGLDVSSPLSVS